MDLLTYLYQHLLPASGLPASLPALAARGMAPQPSYRLRLAIECDSFFGAHSESAALAFYASGTPAWLDEVAALADGGAAFALFTRRYLARARQLGAAPDEASVRGEWDAFLDGTYGLCTRTGLPEAIAEKEVAIGRIKPLLALAHARALTRAETADLHQWVDLLDAASAPFAPHEVARSSRRRLVDEVRAAYPAGA